MANLNVRNGAGAAVAGALPIVLAKYGGRVPAVGGYLTQYAAPAAGVIAVGAHLLANSRQASQFGTEGMAYGGVAVLGNYAANMVFSRMLGTPSFAAEARGVLGDAPLIPALAPAAGVRAEAPASKTLRIDM